MISEIAKRYAKALFEIAKASNKQDQIFAELKMISLAFQNKEINHFLLSPLNSAEAKVKIFNSAFKEKISSDLLNTLILLAEKNRLNLVSEVAQAYELFTDNSHGIVRGKVRSASELNSAEKQKINETVNKVTKKQVILDYEIDKNLLGGMVAQVAGWTFDDSLAAHLINLNEDLNRRSH